MKQVGEASLSKVSYLRDRNVFFVPNCFTWILQASFYLFFWNLSTRNYNHTRRVLKAMFFFSVDERRNDDSFPHVRKRRTEREKGARWIWNIISTRNLFISLWSLKLISLALFLSDYVGMEYVEACEGDRVEGKVEWEEQRKEGILLKRMKYGRRWSI